MAILNKHHLPGKVIPAGAVYIGRGSTWGNPFTHIPGIPNTVLCKDRDEACDKHAEYLRQQVRTGQVSLEALASLHGKDLVCFCAPARCHGEILVKAAQWAHDKLNTKE